MELLEKIRKIANMDYISDLSRGCLLDFYQLHKLEQIDAQIYSLKEWNETARYISNKKYYLIIKRMQKNIYAIF